MSNEEKITYQELVKKVKADYKSRLKNLSKNQLISVVAELSTKVAVLKDHLKEQNNEKITSNNVTANAND